MIEQTRFTGGFKKAKVDTRQATQYINGSHWTRETYAISLTLTWQLLTILFPSNIVEQRIKICTWGKRMSEGKYHIWCFYPQRSIYLLYVHLKEEKNQRKSLTKWTGNIRVTWNKELVKVRFQVKRIEMSENIKSWNGKRAFSLVTLSLKINFTTSALRI